jgi:carboxyl-terminal processing protease
MTLPPSSDPTASPVQPIPPPRGGMRGTRPSWPLALAFIVVAFLGGAFVDRALVSGAFFGPSSPAPAASPVPGATGAPPSDGATAAPTPTPTPPTGEDAFALIRQSWDLLHERYVGRADLDDQALAHAAIDAMTEAVGDTDHTVFLTPQQVADAEAGLSGEYVGIGALVDHTDEGILIEGVFPDSPADVAGLGVGDLIIGVDGATIQDETVRELAERIRGDAGTSVRLRVDPAGPAGPEDVTLTRESVTIPVVDWAMLPGTTIADVRLYQFSNGATEKLVEALRAARAAGATALVFDLRSNPGGFVDQAVGVASQFLSSGNVFLTEDAEGKREPSAVRPDGAWTDLPVVVLVDRSTASAAEIVASALQEGRGAVVVGEQTFGTGTVLNRFGLTDGSALEIGVQRWLTRDGDALWHEGLTPDRAVVLGDAVQPVSPADLDELGAAGLQQSGDTQLLDALRELGGA